MVIALLTAAVVLGALFLLWQVRTIIGWGVLAFFLAVVLNPAVDWLQRRGIGRSIGILLTYLGVLAALVLIAGIFVPVVVSEIRDLIDFVVAVVQNPAGITEYLRNLLEQLRFGFLFDTLSERLAELPSQLGQLVRSFLLSAGGLAISASVVTALGVLRRRASPGQTRVSTGCCGRATRRAAPILAARRILRRLAPW